MLKAIALAVFSPRKVRSTSGWHVLFTKWGWLFIPVRWAYYSGIFVFFRDYEKTWRPFVPPPFGLSYARYAQFQQIFSVPFGMLLMILIALVLYIYMGLRNRPLSFLNIINVLGVTYFLPFLLLQPIDVLSIFTVGGVGLVIAPLHSIVLLWEAIATVIIVGGLAKLSRADYLIAVLLQVGTWIGICAPLWR